MPALIEKTIQCPSCATVAQSEIKEYHGAGREHILAIEGLAECPSCGLVFAFPMPTEVELESYYANGDYWHQQVQPCETTHLHSLSQALARTEWCARYLHEPPKDVADIGAGYGWQADALVNTFGNSIDRYYFIEPDDNAAATILNRQLGVKRSRVLEIGELPEHDLIFLNQVVEHVAQPIKFLTAASTSLRPGGYVYIETPHRDDLFKADIFPHTLFFSEKSLSNQIAKAQLELVSIEEFGRLPSTGFISLAQRALFRLGTSTKWRALAINMDSRLWQYNARSHGIWLRALARKPT
ncbi:MAG: class I SAM-dependent methyltransferase [Deltaproteobacteria bacterium]|nr:class I SAM-dependent methyltransferase [Deltaproteobacteria bacterium]